MSGTELIRAGSPQGCTPWERHLLTIEQWGALSRIGTPRLAAMWADPTHVHAAFHGEGDLVVASVTVSVGQYPALSPKRPAAAWFERMIRDLWGHAAREGTDLRPWHDHGRWPLTAPLASRPGPAREAPPQPDFLPAEGESLHIVPVGPVHAGIIEPGHFRFHAQGETVVRLETRLGYAHKGLLSLMQGKSPRAAAIFAARISGDSTVAHAIAFARASEAATGITAPSRADALRAVMAEVERIANHLNDIGFITNDAAFAPLHARTGYLREMLLRAAKDAFGHRLMMDSVIPGGVADDIQPGGDTALLRVVTAIEEEWPALMHVYDSYASLADRVAGTGIIKPELVTAFAAGGVVGRAAGRGFDARRDLVYPPYDQLLPGTPLRQDGDVDARVRVRAEEVVISLRLLRTLLADLPSGPVAVPLPHVEGEGIGVSEGFRGDVFHWMRLDAGGLIAAVFARDPSWFHWPLLEAAIEDNIIADFPLCNKSVNGSYSGVDL